MSDAETEALKKLNYIKNNSPYSVPSTTRIRGFFNPQPWPVRISANLLNINLTLEQKGSFIVDSTGNKINDPRLMQYVGPNMLSVEYGDEEIPVRTASAPVIPQGVHGFSGTKAVPSITDHKPLKPAVDKPAKQSPPRATVGQVATNAEAKTPVRGMTMEEARKAGLLGNARPIAEDIGVEETTGAPIAGEKIPTIEAPLYPKPKTIPAYDKMVENEAVIPAPVSETISDAVQETISSIELPHAEPNLGEEEPQTTTTPEPSATLPFVDPVSGKGFKFRSQLENFAKRKYPASKVNEIMAAYPKS